MSELKRRPFGERNIQVDSSLHHRPIVNSSTDKGLLLIFPLGMHGRETENSGNGEAKEKLAVMNGKESDKVERPLKKKLYSLSDFILGPLIGSGKYGRVYYARDRLHDRDVALKRLDVYGMQADQSEKFEREIEIQGHLEHPNIIRLYGFFSQADKLFLVLEYAREGSLFDLLQKIHHMNERTVAQSMIKALDHLHSHGVIHRDIKPENILIGEDGTPKLTDFGWSVLTKERRYTMCGTMDYVAPEMIIHSGYDNRVDIWSLGVLCYELLIGYPPFTDNNTFLTSRRIQNVDYTFPDQPIISKAAKDFISTILVCDPEARMGLDDMLHHGFLRRR